MKALVSQTEATKGNDTAQPVTIEITEYAEGELPLGNRFLAYMVQGDRRAFVGGHKTREGAEKDGAFHLPNHVSFLSTEESEFVRNVAMHDIC